MGVAKTRLLALPSPQVSEACAPLLSMRLGDGHDEADGAARVLDPIFLHVADPTWRIHGKLWKDYHVTPW